MSPFIDDSQVHSQQEGVMSDVADRESLRGDGFNPSENGHASAKEFSTPRANGSEPLIMTQEDGVMPIAIVGMSCRFPGGSSSPAKLWDMLAAGRSGWSEVPPERFVQNSFYHPSSDMTGTFNSKGAHFLEEDISLFDAPFFNIGPTEAKALDPQIRLQLELAYEALENAGMTIESVAGTDTAVFVGVFANDYDRMMLCDPEDISAYHAVGNGNAMFSNRLSYYFDLKGPSVTLDTGCSASLVALHQACQSIRSGESSQAIVGGTNLMLDPKTMMSLSKVGFLSHEGRCYSFDSRGSGYGRGEGVASVIIKPLTHAIAAGDPIRAVIRNTGVNQDGKTPGITMPSSEAQQDLIRATYSKARLDTHHTAYVEAHGTGTAAGDPIEVSAIAASIGYARSPEKPLLIGSIKTNIGHLESASGLAGLIKATLCLEKGLLPPNINFEQVNPSLALSERNMKVAQELQLWPGNSIRRASVNSFGYGGTNAHVILDAYGYSDENTSEARMDHLHVSKSAVREQEHAEINSKLSEGSRGLVFVFSHKTKAGVERLIKNIKLYNSSEHCDARTDHFHDLAHTLSSNRSALTWRTAFTASTSQDLKRALEEPGIEPRRALHQSHLGMMFTGQGAQWYAMGRELIRRSSIFRRSLEAAEGCLRSLGVEWSLIDELMQSQEKSRVNSAAIGQSLCTAVQIAMVDLLRSWNVLPTAVVGHSSGEIAAAYACGSITFTTALTIAYHRGRLAGERFGNGSKIRGAMLAVGLSEQDVQTYIAKVPEASGKIVVACVNSPRSVTVSGDRAAVVRLQSVLEARQIFVRRLAINVAYHSHHVEIMAPEYLASLSDLPSPTVNSDVAFYSSVYGKAVSGENLDAAYWVKNAVSQVRFSEALQGLCVATRDTNDRLNASWSKPAVGILVEVGPHSALAGFFKQIMAATLDLAGPNIKYIASLVREKNAVQTSLELASELFVAGYPIDLKAVNFSDIERQPRVIVDLPPYPWDHSVSYWHESRLSSEFRHRPTPRHPLLGAQAPNFNPLEPEWRNIVRVSEIPWITGHVIQSNIVYPAAGYIAMALEASLQRFKASGKVDVISRFRLREVNIGRALLVPNTPEGIETILSLRPYNHSARKSSDLWDEFRVFSYTKDDGWTQHCWGLVSVETLKDASEVEGHRELEYKIARYQSDIEAARAQCHVVTEPTQMYETLRSFGLDYQDTFASVDSVVTGPHQSLGTVRIPDTSATMLGSFEHPHVLHPAMLDSCLQIAFPCLLKAGKLCEPMVPTYIAEIAVSMDVCKDYGERLLVHATTAPAGNRACKMNMTAASVMNKVPRLPMIEITGLTLTTIPGITNLDQQSADTRNISHKMEWAPDVDLMSPQIIRELCSPPSLSGSTTSQASHPSYDQLVKYVELLAHKKPDLHILEIGANSGDAARAISETMARKCNKDWQYHCTSKAADALRLVEESQSSWRDSIVFKQLIIEEDPQSQAFQFGYYDLIVASDDWHATSRSDDPIQNMRKLLRSGGKLLLQTSTQSQLDRGRLPEVSSSANNCDEEMRPESSATTIDLWSSSALTVGFSRLDTIFGNHGEQDTYGHSIHIATAIDDISCAPATLEIHILGPATPSPASESIQSALCTLLGQTSQAISSDICALPELSADGKVCICLAELEESILNSCNENQWTSIRKMLSSASCVLWITRGGAMNTKYSEAGLMTGLARSARSDNEALRLVTLDLDPCQKSAEDTPRIIMNTLRASFSTRVQEQSRDSEYAERDGRIYIPRLVEDQNLQAYLTASTTEPKTELQPFFQHDRPLRLEVETPGLLDSIRFVEDETPQRSLGADELRMDLRASGVNFRDVMISLGQLDDSSIMCGEHSGVVNAVGPGLTDRFHVGDRICAWGGNAYASSVVVNGLSAQNIPDDMSFETAASIPIVYTTAYYSLVHLARLKKGETVLIHSAAGGVGQAAVMLAQHLGAKIFVTVGNNEKKALVTQNFGLPEEQIFSSRDTSFVQGIKRLTEGRGVDVVLNSIAGEGFRETCRCVATLGRFIEIGKRDILMNGRLDMEMFNRNVMFASVDLTLVFGHDPNLGASILREVFEMLRRKVISTIEPITVYPFSQMESAFRLIQAGKHMGKVVLRADLETTVKVVPRVLAPATFDENSSYLIIGGLGGLGRAMCRWMASLKAKNIILISRSGMKSQSALCMASELQQAGVQLKAYACDVSDFEQLDQTLGLCAKEMPPIRGVIQAAMVLRDTIIDKMTLSEYQQATRPKVDGTRNLHTLLSSTRLDFFLLLSSCAGLIGNSGQGNYASACTFQDAFARYRTGLGLPTRSLDLGMIESAGYVSENLDSLRFLTAQGFTPVKLSEFLALLSYAVSTPVDSVDSSQLVVGLTRIDKTSLLPSSANTTFLSDAKFSHLVTSTSISAEGGSGGGRGQHASSSLQQSIRSAASASEAHRLVTCAIVEKVSQVLVVPVEDISPLRAISSYGGDSLAAVELRNWFVRSLEANVGVMEILAGKSIEALAGDVLGRSKLVMVVGEKKGEEG